MIGYLRRARERFQSGVGGTQWFHQTKLFTFLLFHISVLTFAGVLFIAAVVPNVRAQNVLQVEDLSRRITSLEGLNLDHRLTIIETLLNDLHSDHWTHTGTMIGTALLILERGARAVAKKVKEEDGA